MQTPSLSFVPIFMKDAHSAESNEKSILRFFQFLFFELSWRFIENWQFWVQKYHITKTKNGKIYISLVSTHSASFLLIWTLLNFFFYFDARDLLHAKDWRDFWEPDSDTNQFRLGSSIKKHTAPWGAPRSGGVGGPSPPTNFFFSQIFLHFQKCSNLQGRCGLMYIRFY